MSSAATSPTIDLISTAGLASNLPCEARQDAESHSQFHTQKYQMPMQSKMETNSYNLKNTKSLPGDLDHFAKSSNGLPVPLLALLLVKMSFSRSSTRGAAMIWKCIENQEVSRTVTVSSTSCERSIGIGMKKQGQMYGMNQRRRSSESCLWQVAQSANFEKIAKS